MTQKPKYPGLTLLHRGETPYPDSPDAAKLEAFPNAYPARAYHVRFDCPEFTSRCPVTNQPDFGAIMAAARERRKLDVPYFQGTFTTNAP